jgi:hypothetical protein
MQGYLPLISAEHLRGELELAHHASTVELTKDAFRAHIMQALAAVEAPLQGANQIEHPLVSAHDLHQLWCLHAVDDTVPLDADTFRDIVLQAMSAIAPLSVDELEPEAPAFTLH